MYKNILRSLEDASIFPVVSIIIFTLFFAGLIIWVVAMDKKRINEMAAMPLEGEEEELLATSAEN